MSAVVTSAWCICTLWWDVVLLSMASNGHTVMGHTVMGQPAGSGLSDPLWIKEQGDQGENWPLHRWVPRGTRRVCSTH